MVKQSGRSVRHEQLRQSCDFAVEQLYTGIYLQIAVTRSTDMGSNECSGVGTYFLIYIILKQIRDF